MSRIRFIPLRRTALLLVDAVGGFVSFRFCWGHRGGNEIFCPKSLSEWRLGKFVSAPPGTPPLILPCADAHQPPHPDERSKARTLRGGGKYSGGARRGKCREPSGTAKGTGEDIP